MTTTLSQISVCGAKVIKVLVHYIRALRRDILIRAGAIFSSVGTILLALLILALLIFPIVKNCSNQEECDYFSTAPEPLNYFVTPIFVTVDLFVIATGVLFMRFARWYTYKV
ncbi:MAG TPA: hypothetical protein VJ551_02240 [Nitrososphaeraceae archaeon]|nr:hypothetical protein [Nitrososphaeraceae archaeon]